MEPEKDSGGPFNHANHADHFYHSELSIPPASSSGYSEVANSDAACDSEPNSGVDSVPVVEPVKKKRKIHLTANREILQQEPSSSSGGRQSRNTKKAIYAPEKRSYVKKSKK